MPQLETTADDRTLEGIAGIGAGESVEYNFTVVQDGSPKPLSGDALRVTLREREYVGSEAVLDSDTDPGVEIIDGTTDPRVDPAAGEFWSRIDASATAPLAGEYWLHVSVDPVGETAARWVGRVLIES